MSLGRSSHLLSTAKAAPKLHQDILDQVASYLGPHDLCAMAAVDRMHRATANSARHLGQHVDPWAHMPSHREVWLAHHCGLSAEQRNVYRRAVAQDNASDVPKISDRYFAAHLADFASLNFLESQRWSRLVYAHPHIDARALRHVTPRNAQFLDDLGLGDTKNPRPTTVPKAQALARKVKFVFNSTTFSHESLGQEHVDASRIQFVIQPWQRRFEDVLGTLSLETLLMSAIRQSHAIIVGEILHVGVVPPAQVQEVYTTYTDHSINRSYRGWSTKQTPLGACLAANSGKGPTGAQQKMMRMLLEAGAKPSRWELLRIWKDYSKTHFALAKHNRLSEVASA